MDGQEQVEGRGQASHDQGEERALGPDRALGGATIDFDFPVGASCSSSIRAGILIRSCDPAVLGPSGEFPILSNLAHLSDAGFTAYLLYQIGFSSDPS